MSKSPQLEKSHPASVTSARGSKIALASVVASPFRDFTINPLDENRIVKLVESIETTGFWKNIIVRENSKGQFEIVFGHHRLEALRRKYGKNEEFDFNVVKLSDAEVLQRMSRDHDDAYGHGFEFTMEIVKATVNAIASGEIKLEIPSNSNAIRVAPGFVRGANRDSRFAYNMLSVARFLGRTCKNDKESNDDVRAAFAFLELVELKVWEYSRLESYRDKRSGRIVVQSILDDYAKSATRHAHKTELQKEEAKRVEADNTQALIERQKREQKAAEYLKELQKKQQQKLAPKQEEKVKEQIKEAKAEVKDASRQVTRTKDAIARRKEIEAEQKRKDEEQKARRAEEDRVRWVNSVVTQGNKTFDRFCMVRNNFLGLSKAERRHAQITASDKKKLIASLDGICDRVRETIAALKDAPVIEPQRSGR